MAGNVAQLCGGDELIHIILCWWRAGGGPELNNLATALGVNRKIRIIANSGLFRSRPPLSFCYGSVLHD